MTAVSKPIALRFVLPENAIIVFGDNLTVSKQTTVAAINANAQLSINVSSALDITKTIVTYSYSNTAVQTGRSFVALLSDTGELLAVENLASGSIPIGQVFTFKFTNRTVL